MTNGLLHVPTRTLRPHTPQFFNHHALPFAFEPEAPPPTKWLAFLARTLGRRPRPRSRRCRKSIGYLLGGDTSLQKMFLLVGPKRGGKGTIGRVLTGLLGAHHVAAPTLGESLDELRAATAHRQTARPRLRCPALDEGRLEDRRRTPAVGQRRRQPDDRPQVQGALDRPAADPFLIMTNELPRLSDASGALASRFILFVLTQSFYGSENPKLTDELLAEAPAIFNWALEGLDRLNARGYFVNPESGADAIQQMEDLSSPISAFIRDRCVVGGRLPRRGRCALGRLEDLVRGRQPPSGHEGGVWPRPAGGGAHPETRPAAQTPATGYTPTKGSARPGRLQCRRPRTTRTARPDSRHEASGPGGPGVSGQFSTVFPPRFRGGVL